MTFVVVGDARVLEQVPQTAQRKNSSPSFVWLDISSNDFCRTRSFIVKITAPAGRRSCEVRELAIFSAGQIVDVRPRTKSLIEISRRESKVQAFIEPSPVPTASVKLVRTRTGSRWSAAEFGPTSPPAPAARNRPRLTHSLSTPVRPPPVKTLGRFRFLMVCERFTTTTTPTLSHLKKAKNSSRFWLRGPKVHAQGSKPSDSGCE